MKSSRFAYVLMVFCAYMTFIYMPFDLFYKPVDQDSEVWFGYALHGWAAKATEPLHWLIYGAGFYGFLKMKSWMFPWAALYVFQVAIAMFVFALFRGEINSVLGIAILYAIAIPFVALGVMLWRAKPNFTNGMALDIANETANDTGSDSDPSPS